jgi:chemotaxis protein CheX
MTLHPDIIESTHFSDEMLAEYVIDVTREVFSTMVMMEVTGIFPLKEPIKRFKCSITGMVGLAGRYYSGMISVHCPLDLALKIASNMIGSGEVVDDSERNDAIGEIANMLGGSVKHVLSNGGLDIKLSVPTVISGENYTINSLSNADCVVVPFTVEEQTMLVGLTLKRVT